MISSVVCLSDKHLNSEWFSLQQEHVELHAKGSLYSIVLCDKGYAVLNVYKGQELNEVVGKAIANGRRRSTNPISGDTEFYYLARR